MVLGPGGVSTPNGSAEALEKFAVSWAVISVYALRSMVAVN